MSRNRKNQSTAVRFGPAVKAILLCAFLGGSGLGYVGQKNQLYILGSQFKDLETRVDKLRRENSVRARIVDALQTPSELEVRIKQMNLSLVAPQPGQIVRLAEYPEGLDQAAGRMYAERAGAEAKN